MTARTLLTAALFVALGTALAQPPAGTGTAPAAQPAKKPGDAKPDLARRLAERVTVNKAEGKFRDVVQSFAAAYDLPLIVSRSVEHSPNGDGDDIRGERPVKFAKMADVRLSTALAAICEQAECKFLVYPDHIRVVPDSFAAYETGVLTVNTDPNPSNDEVPLLPNIDLLRSKPLTKRGLVNAAFKARPLAEVLDEIAEQTGANVTLSPIVPAAVRTAPITARFANAPVDAVVRTLTEMTETGVIEDANVILVTTRERATARAKEEAQKLKDRQPPVQPVVNFVPAPADLNAEVAKLKDQNEQTAKQLEVLLKSVEELQKSVKKLSDK